MAANVLSGPSGLPAALRAAAAGQPFVIHRWGWTITLHPDGTAIATSASGRNLHTNDPPARVA